MSISYKIRIKLLIYKDLEKSFFELVEDNSDALNCHLRLKP